MRPSTALCDVLLCMDIAALFLQRIVVDFLMFGI